MSLTLDSVYVATDTQYMTTTATVPGSGAITCECGAHRNRCKFGRPHIWFLVTEGGVETADCAECGAHCETDD